MIDSLRISAGTASVLGLKKVKMKEEPTTAYTMIPGGTCRGGCTFCPQAMGDSKWLSRVSWPKFKLNDVVDALKSSDLERICLQSPDIPDYEEKIVKVVREFEGTGLPISLSTPPLTQKTLDEVQSSVDRIGVGIDAVTDKKRQEIKPNYDARVFWDYLGRAVDVLGRGKVTAHIMAGVEDNLLQLAYAVNRANYVGAEVSLFSYRTKEKETNLDYYRRAQIVTHLVEDGKDPEEAVWITDKEPEKIEDIIKNGEVFQTQGCPGCNRPYYTTRPGDEHRNFPRELTIEELEKIKEELGLF